MKIKDIVEGLGLEIVTGGQQLEEEIEWGFASDLMSDVLTLDKSSVLLVTGLCNIQAIRTAEMSEIKAIIIARGKKPGMDMIKLAQETDLVLLKSKHSVFYLAGKLFKLGLKAIY